MSPPDINYTITPIRKRWAFLVGVNRYTDYDRLRYCVDDVIVLETLLKAAGYTVLCLHDRHDRVDEDGNPNRLFPTEKNIKGRLTYLCSMIKQGPNQGADDLLLVYFACHGSRQPDDVPRLIAWDTQQSLIDDAIAVSKIEEQMEASGAGCRMLMLDACHIGLGTSGLGARKLADPTLLRRIHDKAKGYALLTASTNTQEAKEWSGRKHGIFSHYVLEGLSGAADLHGKDYITVNDLAGYVNLRIQEWAVERQIEQSPCQRIENNLGGFILIPENCQQKISGLCLSEPSNSSVVSEQSVQSRGSSTQGQGRRTSAGVIECLWSLDYGAQDRIFKTHTPRSKRAAAFVVQAKDSRIQSWLVKRLANKIPDVAKANVFTITVPKHPMWRNRDFNEFWVELSKKLKCESESTQVIEALVKVYQTTPIVLAMYGWSATSRSQELQKQVIDKFWTPLLDAVEALTTQPLRSRLVLFLAEGNDTVTDIASQNPANDSSGVPIRLEPLSELTSDHVAEWLERDDVYSLLQKLMPEDHIARLINEEILDWSTDPAQTIEEICYVFDLEGIEEVQAEWRLAG